MPETASKYDIFISHASEDKESVARPLAHELRRRGLKVWLDECELTLGDSLRRKIDDGLASSRYGVVVLSPAFFAKEWPNKELDGLVSREDGSGKVVLPVWHNLNANDVLRFSPLLAGKVAISTSKGMSPVVVAITQAIGTGGVTGGPSVSIDPASESLLRIRRDMLVASSAQDLRRCKYELETHMSRYTMSAEARELEDKLANAIERARHYEGREYESARMSSRSRSPLAAFFGFIWVVIVLAMLGMIAVGLFTTVWRWAQSLL